MHVLESMRKISARHTQRPSASYLYKRDHLRAQHSKPSSHRLIMSAPMTASTNTTARSSTTTIAAGPSDKAPLYPYPGLGTADSPYLVDWEEGEKANPYTWSNPRKWGFTFVIAISTLCVAFASSCYSGAVTSIRAEFNISNEVAIVGISVFVLGFGTGPLIWAPISEWKGRRIVFICSMLPFALFNLAGALAKNTETLLITRFLAGAFGSSLLTVAGAALSDIWSAAERGLATSLFALAPFLGPVIGPVVGGYVAEKCDWNIVFYVMFAFAMTMFLLGLIFVPETYAPTLLRRKAAALQKEADKNGSGLHFIAKYDVQKKKTSTMIKMAFAMPFQLLFGEVIVMALSLYTALIYAILYLFFTAYPIVFQRGHGWGPGKGSLPFIAMGVGMCAATCMAPLSAVFYRRAAKKAGPGQPVPPEALLPMACIGGILLPIGLFWFAWTSGPEVHWIAPTLAGIPFGAGMCLVFTSVIGYLILSYGLFAASALASNALLRSVLGAAFPLFSVQMYEKLGLHWAGSLLAFLALACAPMPFLFMKYGPKLRARSRFAPSAPAPKVTPTVVAPDVDYSAESTTREKLPEANGVEVDQTAENSALEPEFALDAGMHPYDHHKTNESPV